VHSLKQKGHGSDLLTQLSDEGVSPSVSAPTDVLPVQPFALENKLSSEKTTDIDNKNFKKEIPVALKENFIPLSLNENFRKEIPLLYQDKALDLLHHLQSHKDINWDQQGKLTLEGEQLAQNFFELFPKLFINKEQHLYPGLQKLANFISTLGHGHLLHSHHTAGLILPKKRKLQEDRELIKQRFGKKWYYLGP
jgi:hypothetical protein